MEDVGKWGRKRRRNKKQTYSTYVELQANKNMNERHEKDRKIQKTTTKKVER